MKGDPSEPRHRTQRRRTETAARLLGLSLTIGEGLSQQVARTLDVMGLDHAGARRAFAKSPSLIGRGQAIAGLIDGMAIDTKLWERLLAAGHLVGLWGEPLLWDPRIGRRRFPRLGTSVATRDRSPPPPPTK